MEPVYRWLRRFFIQSQDELVYLYSAAYDTFKKYNAPYAIQWHMLQYALKHGIRKYNFYGLSGDFDKNAQDYGVYEFKKRLSRCRGRAGW